MNEIAVPQHDGVILRAITHDEKTAFGIIVPQPGDYKELRTEQEQRQWEKDNPVPSGQDKRKTNRYKVLAVGPGQYIDVADDVRDQVFLRRPMHTKVGDIVIAEEGPKPFICNGEQLWCAKDWQLLARVEKGEGGDPEKIIPLNDYVFSEVQQRQILTSAGGLHLPGKEDPTGNKKLPVRFEAREVSEGPWCVRWQKGREPSFARRPMAVKQGQPFLFDGTGFLVHVGGASRVVVQNFMICTTFEAA